MTRRHFFALLAGLFVASKTQAKPKRRLVQWAKPGWEYQWIHLKGGEMCTLPAGSTLRQFAAVERPHART